MFLDIIYWLFALIWVILLPAYFTQRIFLGNVESPAGRAGLSMAAVLVLLPTACFGLASLLRMPVDEIAVFSVSTAWNLFGMLHRVAAYRRRMHEEG